MIGGEDEHDEAHVAVTERRVALQPRAPELEIGRGHDGEQPLVEAEPAPRHVLDRAACHPREARLDDVHGLRRRKQPFDVLLGEVQRHGGLRLSPAASAPG